MGTVFSDKFITIVFYFRAYIKNVTNQTSQNQPHDQKIGTEYKTYKCTIYILCREPPTAHRIMLRHINTTVQTLSGNCGPGRVAAGACTPIPYPHPKPTRASHVAA